MKKQKKLKKSSKKQTSNLTQELLESLKLEAAAKIDYNSHEILQQQKMQKVVMEIEQERLQPLPENPSDIEDGVSYNWEEDKEQPFEKGELENLLDIITPPTGAIKHDSGKVRMSLISPIATFKTAQVMTNGEKEYSSHNWRNGFAWSRVADAALRHLQAWIAGMDNDPDGKGSNNLDHAAACIMMLQEFTETKKELDDRYKLPKEVLDKMYPKKESK